MLPSRTKGICPAIIWSPISEIWGRKLVYVVSLMVRIHIDLVRVAHLNPDTLYHKIFTAAAAVASRAMNGAVFLSMRLLTAVGGSSTMAIGAGTLAVRLADPL
jgi:MFS family permease